MVKSKQKRYLHKDRFMAKKAAQKTHDKVRLTSKREKPVIKNGVFVDGPVLFDLANDEDRKLIADLYTDEDGSDAIETNMCLNAYLKFGEYTTYYGKYHVVYHNNFYVVSNGLVYGVLCYGKKLSELTLEEIQHSITSDIPTAVILPYGLKNDTSDKALHVMVNADEGDEYSPRSSLVGELSDKTLSISFECIRRFYENKTVGDVVKMIANGRITLVDFNPDSEVELSDDDRIAYAKGGAARKKLKSPGPGYTLIQHGMRFRWHRSATVLLRDTSRDGHTMLFGQDEGTYFGCKLRNHPKTVADAYTSLMPPVVREMPACKRQGEWYLVPVDEKDVPKVPECIATFGMNNYDDSEWDTTDSHHGNFALYRDSEESSCHYVECDYGRITKDGQIYAENATLRHEKEDHVDVSERGWVTFYRNTALQSVSVEGVD